MQTESTAPDPSASRPVRIGARLRVVLGEDVAIGPGKADILEGIRETGSIAAAGRRMGMSYKRAWLMVESMNRCFSRPLVSAVKGGARGGGAALTPLGEEVLTRYRTMQALAEEAIAGEVRALLESMSDETAGDA
jgi:molybdate transport system regulatory protein